MTARFLSTFFPDETVASHGNFVNISQTPDSANSAAPSPAAAVSRFRPIDRTTRPAART